MAEDTAVDPAGAAGEQASAVTEPSSYSESDFKARAQRDPEFAWNQVRQFQSKYDKAASAEEKYQKLVEMMGKDMADYVQRNGGTDVWKYANSYAFLKQDPTMSETLQYFEQTGQLPKQRNGSETKVENEDEYKTPEEKELESVKAELAQIKQRLGSQALNSGKQAIKEHMERVARDYDFSDETFEKMRQSVISNIETWSKVGGEVGERALQSLIGEGGFNQIKGLMLQVVEPSDIQAAWERANLRKQGKLGELSTGGPGRVASAGKEAPPSFGNDWAEAAKWARNNPDRHDSY